MHSWFAEARLRLQERGTRPLRAIADYDEALMLYRRDGTGDSTLARQLREDALRQFQELGMTGWVRNAELLGPALMSSRSQSTAR